jgi:hypothetical protein
MVYNPEGHNVNLITSILTAILPYGCADEEKSESLIWIWRFIKCACSADKGTLFYSKN